MSLGTGRLIRGNGLAAAFAALAATAGVAALAGPAAATTCSAGTHAYGSGQARTFCGPASATVTIAGHKTTLKGGDCERTATGFTINIGTVLLGVASSTPPNYFGITVGKPAYPTPASKDGTYHQGAVAIVVAHKSYAMTIPTITLAGNRTKGTFSGTLLTGGTASGSFSCG